MYLVLFTLLGDFLKNRLRMFVFIIFWEFHSCVLCCHPSVSTTQLIQWFSNSFLNHNLFFNYSFYTKKLIYKKSKCKQRNTPNSVILVLLISTFVLGWPLSIGRPRFVPGETFSCFLRNNWLPVFLPILQELSKLQYNCDWVWFVWNFSVQYL